jgi:methionine-rich copper-binding protein CopC
MSTSIRRRFSAAVPWLLLLLFLACPRLALAHAILVRSTPASHAVVDGHHLAIELHYNSRVDGARSKLTLTLTSDATLSHPLPLGALQQTAPDTLTSAADSLAPGEYTLHWLVLASDGHISHGDIPFTVH